MDCKLEIHNLNPENRAISILYATHNFIVYKERNGLVLASCDGSRLSDITIAVDCLNYECLDLEDALLFMFSGSEILILDKSGMVPVKHKLNPTTLGRCISKIYRFSGSTDQIVFGSQHESRIQFVNYDFMNQVRIAQTASWNASAVTDTLLIDTILYAVLDKTIIVAVDMSTGELLWTKFETAEITPGLVTYDKYLLYTCHGMLKKTDGQETQAVRIPLMNISSILYATDREAFMTTNENKNIICYSLVLDKLKWEIFGNDPIHERVLVKSSEDDDILAVRTDQHVALINISTGKSEYNIKTRNIARLRQTGDHLLIQKHTGTSTLVPGIRNDFD